MKRETLVCIFSSVKKGDKPIHSFEPTIQIKEELMQDALELAAQARGRTSPNPMVGAILVKDDKIVGKGYHKKAGTPHAEIHAIRDAGELAKEATLYVTLEPCCHWGRTPPCTQAIIDAEVDSVVIAMLDPNPRVSGKGVEEMKENGIDVHVGLLESEAKKLNEAYIKHVQTGIPFVILKTAMSLDGKIATKSYDSKWISNEESRRKVHEIRDSVDAICVGIGTVLKDNPRLTTRLPDREGKDAARVVLDSKARIPLDAKILHLNSPASTIIATTEKASEKKVKQLKSVGAEIIVTPSYENHVDFSVLMKELGKRGVLSVLVEGGGEVNASALKSGIVDKLMFFIAPKLVGGRTAPGPIGGEGVDEIRDAITPCNLEISKIGDDFLIEGKLKDSEGG